MELLLATLNKGKVREMEKILTTFLPKLTLLTLEDFGIAGPLVENGQTLEANAIEKALWAYRQTGKTALSDDSGLEVDALDGAPGVYSARFAGLEATAAENNQKLLQRLLGVTERSARFKTVLCLAGPFGQKCWDGNLEGYIATESRGRLGFGYDPLFIPEGFNRTLAELDEQEKNEISHRQMAISKMVKFLVEEFR